MRNKLLIIGIVALLFITSCGDDTEVQKEKVNPTLVSFTKKTQYQYGDLKGYINISGLDVDVSQLIYAVDVHEMTYNTDFENDSLEVSALVFMPIADQIKGTISFQHGTIASNAEAPTSQILGNWQVILGAAMASAGYLVVVPDYIGFGKSKDVYHPYYIEDLSATTVINALYGAAQIAATYDSRLNDQLILTGYSQGGYVTMAAHKYIEQQGIEFFNLVASFPASGGYDVLGFRDYYFDQELYDQPFFMAFVAHSYKETYDFDLAYGDIFNQPYDAVVSQYFDGNHSGTQINAVLNDTVALLVNSDFLANPNASVYSEINAAFQGNSLTDWVPKKPMYLYHGDQDKTVPYGNSESVYNLMMENGAKADVLSFTTIVGADHYSGFVPYIEDVIREVNQLIP